MQLAYIDDEVENFVLFCASVDCEPEFSNIFSEQIHNHVDYYPEVSLFEDKGYNVVFTDLKLYETFGVDTVIELSKKTNTPIVVLTGMSDMSAKEMKVFTDAGAHDVWSKDRVSDPAFLNMVVGLLND